MIDSGWGWDTIYKEWGKVGDTVDNFPLFVC